MGAENDKVKLHQSKEIQKLQKNIDIKDTIDNVFSAAPKINISVPEKEEIEKALKDSKLNFSKEQMKAFFNKVKEIANKSSKKINLVDAVNKLIPAYKRMLSENKDIGNNSKLTAISKQLEEREKERKNEKIKNQILQSRNTQEKARNTQEKAKNTQEKAKNILRKGEVNKNLEDIETIKATKEAYQKLSPDLKQYSPEQINTKINALSPNTKARLKKSGLSLSDYAQFSLAREKITSLDTKTPEGETFLTTLKKMEKSLGIVEKTDGGYPLSNEPRKETFEQNPQVMEFAKNDESLKGLEKVNVLDDKLNIKQQQKIFQLF